MSLNRPNRWIPARKRNPTPDDRRAIYIQRYVALSGSLANARFAPATFVPYGEKTVQQNTKAMQSATDILNRIADLYPTDLAAYPDDRPAHETNAYRMHLRALAGEPPIVLLDLPHDRTKGFVYPPFTLAEHRILGARLKALTSTLSTTWEKLYNARGPHRDAIVRQAEKAIEDLENLRSMLDSIVFREHRHLTTQELAAVYYGAAETPAVASRDASAA